MTTSKIPSKTTSNFENDMVIGGRYTLREMLGEGAFAEVWRARDGRLSQTVVLKLMRAEFTSEIIRGRFIEEARVMRSLGKGSHEYRHRIVDVLDVADPEDDVLYIALEYLSGGDLYTKLHDQTPSLSAALRLFRMILEGVAVAHERYMERAASVVHRDLKPANILLTNTGEPKVGDFGIASVRHEQTEDGLVTKAFQTRAGTAAGTPGYGSPEQFEDFSAADERSDIFGLGAILAALIAGYEPDSNRRDSLCNEKAQNRLLQGLPNDLRAVIVTACHHDPDKRYQTVREFMAVIDKLIQKYPPVAGEPEWTPRTGRLPAVATASPVPQTPQELPELALGETAIPGEDPQEVLPYGTRVSLGPEDAVAPSIPPFSDGGARRWAVPRHPSTAIIVIAVALLGLGGNLLWRSMGNHPEATASAGDETAVQAPVETNVSFSEVPADTAAMTQDTAATLESEIEVVVEEVVVAEPKPEVKPEAKATVEPRVETVPRVEAVVVEDPKPELITAVRVDLINPQRTVAVGQAIAVNAVIVLPEGKTIASATLRWRGEHGGAWQSKRLDVTDGKASGTISANATMGTAVEYYLDVRLAGEPGKAHKSVTVNATITP